MTPEWLTSPEAFKKHLEAQGSFNDSIGLSEQVAGNYQQALFAGSSREEAFQDALYGLQINQATLPYIRETLENLPGPEDF